jgi:hypothetical protein
MATDARVSMYARRGEDFSFLVRVRGPDLSASALRMQVRDRVGTPGPALLNLLRVTDDSLGLRVMDTRTVDGVLETVIRILIPTASLAQLPWSPVVGGPKSLAFGFMISGKSRLVGDMLVIDSAIDSDNAPLNRAPFTPAGAQAADGSVQQGLTLTIAQDQGVTIALDGADLWGPLLVRTAASMDTIQSIASTSFRSVATYGAREAIPLAQRGNGMRVQVMEGTPRVFEWRTDLYAPGGWLSLYTQAELKNLSIDFTGTLPKERVEGLQPLTSGGARSVLTYSERSSIDTTQLKYGAFIYVTEGERWFVWTKGAYDNGKTDGWVGRQTETESKLIAVDAANTAFGAPQAARIAALETQTISEFVARKIGDQWSLHWTLTGTPVFQRLEWGGYVIELDPSARGITLPATWDGSRITVLGDSMSDGVRAAGTWALKAALRTGGAVTTVALYSAGSKQVYRSGARPVRISVSGNLLPTGGTAVAVTAINGAAPGASNPASLFYTYMEDTAPDSMSGTLGGRRGVLSTTARGSGGQYRWTSNVGEGAVAIGADALFVPDFAAGMGTDELWIWVSQNHFYSGVKQDVNGTPQNINVAIFDEIADMIRKGRGARIVLLGLLPDASWTPGTLQYAAVRAFNAELKRRWPQYYAVDAQGRDSLARILASGNGSTNDNADVANGVTPRSLRLVSGGLIDSLHLGDVGNEVIAQFVSEFRAIQQQLPAIGAGTRFTLNVGAATAVTSAFVSQVGELRTFTSADILDSTSAANTSRKRAGAQIFDTDRVRPLWAGGGDPSSAWVDSAGAVIANPFNTYQGWDMALDFRAGSYRSQQTIARDVSQLPGYSFARTGGTKYELNVAGVLVPVAANTPYIVPGVGYVSRPPHTNLLTNVMAAGVVAGSPGAQPTNWNISNPTSQGVQRTITIVGSEPVTGATIIDVRYFGSNNTGSTIFPTMGLGGAATQAAVQNDIVTSSVFIGIVAGGPVAAGSGYGPKLNLVERDSSNANISGTFSATDIAPTVGRQFVSRKVTSANAAFVNAYVDMGIVAGGTVDVTLRIALPQMTKGTPHSRAGAPR